MTSKKHVGDIRHFYTHISVAVVELKDKMKIGDKISIEGATTNIEQEVSSMQIHNKPVKEAKKGDSIGLKVNDKVREGDKVFVLK